MTDFAVALTPIGAETSVAWIADFNLGECEVVEQRFDRFGRPLLYVKKHPGVTRFQPFYLHMNAPPIWVGDDRLDFWLRIQKRWYRIRQAFWEGDPSQPNVWKVSCREIIPE